MNNIIETIMLPALDQPIWQANKGHGSFLTFDMGKRLISKNKDGIEFFSGSTHLWIYLCDWKLTINNQIIAQNEYCANEIISALTCLNEQRMISIIKIDEITIDIAFSRKINLILTGNESIYGKDADFFILYTTNGILSYNKESGFIAE